MKTFLQLMVWMLLAVVGGAYGADAAPDLTGQWRGTLPIDPKTRLTIQLDIAKRPDGNYVVVLDSPDNGAIKNTPASKVAYADGNLSFEVPSLSGTYAGKAKAGTIAGEWKQPTGALPLTFSPYKPPQLSKAAIDALKGTWVGSVQAPGMKLTTVMTFRVDDKGVPTGTMRSPDQGGGEIPMSNIDFSDGQLSARIPMVAADLAMKLEGDAFTGTLKQPGVPAGMPITMKRGEYVAPVFPLTVGDETKAALTGKWTGQITPPPGAPPAAGPINVTVTFRKNEKSQFVGLIQFAGPARQEFPIQDLLLNGSKLTLKAGPNGALAYTGDLAGKTITGEYTAGPNKIPLTLTRN